MSDLDPTADLQPGANDVTPPADTTSVVPDVPVIPAADDGKLSETEQADADEWGAAADEIFPGLKKSEDDKKPEEGKKDDEPAKPKEDNKKTEEDKKPKEIDPNETPEQKTEREAKEKADADAAAEDEEAEQVEPTDAATRLTEREQKEAVEAVKSDVREKMFKDVPTELRDSDGDTINTVDDVMKLINPSTQEPFTREEAVLWLSQARDQLKSNIESMEKQVEQIADLNLNIKDQADVVNYQYGELLRAMPDLRKQIWEQYEKTLQKDSKSGIITKAPVSLQKFYETALEPYAELGRKLEADQSQQTEAQKKEAEDKAKADAEAKRQRRSDRSDIYGPGKVDTQTDEDKEWAAAAEAVFGPLTK